jgi:hypothetical protein
MVLRNADPFTPIPRTTVIVNNNRLPNDLDHSFFKLSRFLQSVQSKMQRHGSTLP